MNPLREVQYFRQRWLLGLLAGLIAIFLYGSFVQVVRGRPWGDRPVPNVLLLVLTLGTIGFSYWLLRVHLVTEVRPREVFIHYVLLWRPRRLPYSAILSVEAVTYKPLEQYGGWGIRRGRHGWAYTVSGNRGVKLLLAGGEQFLLGSQRAEELAAAIQNKLTG